MEPATRPRNRGDQTRVRWHRSLFGRIAIGFLVAITAVLAVQAIVMVRLADANDQASNAERLTRQERARLLAAELSRALERAGVQELDREVAMLKNSENVFVVMKDGNVSGRRRPGPGLVNIVVTGLNDMQPGQAFPLSWERSDFGGAPVMVQGATVGALGILPRTAFDRFGSLIVGIALMLIGLATVFLSAVIVKPIRARLADLQQVAAMLREGDSAARAHEEGADEVTELAVGFNAMADELERRTAALETSDRLRRQLITDVSHELMTPLTAVLGHLETLTMDEVRLDEVQRQQQVGVAQREAQRLERLIGDLLQAARLEAGGLDLHRETIRIRDLFEELTARHEHDCRKRQITIRSTAADDLVLFADPFRIEQALENLLANALRHTPDGGSIYLNAVLRESVVILEVRDSGEGIPDADLPFIFDRFYKASSSMGVASPGSGLGLTIVKAIVLRHGGKVAAASQPGQGTTIRIELPSAVDVLAGSAAT